MADSHCSLPANTECTTFFTRGQTLGLFIAAEVGLASGIAVVFLLGKIIRNVLRNFLVGRDGKFFKSPLDVYMVSLLLSDLLQALGGILDFRWVAHGSVSCGAACTAQGVIKQLGETGVALATLAIAVHTFFIIFFRRGARAMLLASIIVCVIWLYTIIFVAASLATKGDHFYTPTPTGCWIGRFPNERIFGEYFWLWFSALVSLGLYVPLFFCLRGNITVDANGWRVRFRRRPRISVNKGTRNHESFHEDISQMSRNPAREALIMLLYPACYIALVAPLSIGRWIGFTFDARHPQQSNGILQDIPSAATFVIISIFGLSGLVNVFLLVWTRPGLLLLNDIPTNVSNSDAQVFRIDNADSMVRYMATSARTNLFSMSNSESQY